MSSGDWFKVGVTGEGIRIRSESKILFFKTTLCRCVLSKRIMDTDENVMSPS